MNDGEEVAGEFVTASAGAGPAFEPAEEVLHPVALAVELLVELALVFAVGFAGKAVRGTKFIEPLAQLVVVEAPVSLFKRLLASAMSFAVSILRAVCFGLDEQLRSKTLL